MTLTHSVSDGARRDARSRDVPATARVDTYGRAATGSAVSLTIAATCVLIACRPRWTGCPENSCSARRAGRLIHLA